MNCDENILLDSLKREYWLREISYQHGIHSGKQVGKKILVCFDKSISKSEIKPFHLVTLASLIHHLNSKGYSLYLSRENSEVYDFIYNELGFHQYWKGEKNHVEALSDDRIFNLWRVVDDEKDLYAKNVEDYFRKKYFRDKDLSAISVGLIEAYYNVFDHADAQGNAFSLIQYDEKNCMLHVAISDFGIGIAQSVRNYDSSVKDDKTAILKAVEDKFTTKSTKRNKGLGLCNILSSANEARIFSHYGLVRKSDGRLQGRNCDFQYPGTLIYYDIDLSKMETEEILEEFNF